MNPLKKLYVDTIPNLQARELVHYALLGSQHVLLYGPARSGRTTVVNNLLDEHEASGTLFWLSPFLVEAFSF